ncbi:1,3-beta-glucan synthase component-domain-containing protein [Lactarius pseudohatsudake]|nr:1,3-beta-glucan synthase component-domain-containing protein [Lactarius pseudohatsudake]
MRLSSSCSLGLRQGQGQLATTQATSNVQSKRDHDTCHSLGECNGCLNGCVADEDESEGPRSQKWEGNTASEKTETGNDGVGNGRSFMLGLSIWTPWRDVFTARRNVILATSVRYKPKTDKGFKGSFRVFLPGSEAERRILFFAQSLTKALPEVLPVDAMPDYNEKVLIKESDINTRVTLLEYPKQLHGLEWENFVRDTKVLAQESEIYDGALRAAPKCFGDNTDKLERELEHMARRKFKFVDSMQWYSKFNTEEHENAEFLLRAYPELQIAYLEEEPRKDGGEPCLYFALIDSEFNPQTGRRKPNLKFRIELPENPIRTNKGGGGGV